LSAELTKTHSFRLFFDNFAHWDGTHMCKLAFYSKAKKTQPEYPLSLRF